MRRRLAGTSLEELAETGVARLRVDRERLDHIDRYTRGEHNGPYLPQSAIEPPARPVVWGVSLSPLLLYASYGDPAAATRK